MKRVIVFALFFLAITASVSAQTLSFGLGDAELDTTLNDLNAGAKVDVGGFTAEVSLQWGVAGTQVTAALSQGLAPGEVYFAAFLAQTAGKSLDTVVSMYKKDTNAGWGALAKSLGIKPGSPAFKALKDKSRNSTAKAKKKK